jgi:hypothetical protein
MFLVTLLDVLVSEGSSLRRKSRSEALSSIEVIQAKVHTSSFGAISLIATTTVIGSFLLVLCGGRGKTRTAFGSQE